MREKGYYWLKGKDTGHLSVGFWTGEWWEFIRHPDRFYDEHIVTYSEVGDRISEPS